MNSILKKTFLFLALAPFVLLLSPQFAMSSGAGARTTKSSQQSTDASTPMMPMPLVAPLFIADEEFASTLVLVNGSALKTYADVVLRAPDGTQLAQERVTFDPDSQRQVDVGALLRAKGSSATTGSVVVMPSADLKGPAILAALSMTYLTYPGPNFIDQELAMPSSSDSQVLRGVADRGEGSPLVAVTSLADAAQHVRIDCLGRDGIAFSKTITLVARGTVLTEACTNVRSHGADFASEQHGGENAPRSVTGIALTSDAMPGSFAAFGLAPHQKKEGRYFSSVTFADSKMVMSPNTVFTGVPVGPALLLPGPNYMPELSLANFSNKPAHVAIQYASTSGDASTAQEVWSGAIPAQHTSHIRLDNLQGDSALQNSFVVTSDGAAGDLVAKLVSETGSEGPDVEVLGKDQMVMENGGGHPWSFEDGTDSTLLLFNHSSDTQNVRVSLSNNSGDKLWFKTYALKSMETTQLNIRDLIKYKIPDDSGAVLPATSTSGIAGWFTEKSGVAKGRILQSNATSGMARNFSCGEYADVAGAQWSGNGTYYVPYGTTDYGVGGALAILDLVYPGSCTGSYATTTTAYNYSYSSSSSTVAPVDYPTSDFAEVDGKSVGYATITGMITDPNTGCSASAGVTVIQIQVTSVNLASDQVKVTLNGPSGTSGQLVLTWNGPGPNAAIANTSEGVGTYTFNPALAGLVNGQYTGVAAQWLGVAVTYSASFDVLGSYRHSQYNTPAESQCSGGSGTAYLTPGPSACTWTTVSLIQQFITQAWINGSGVTINYGPCQESLLGCSAPQGGNANYFREVSTVMPGCSSPNNYLSGTSVAVDVFSTNHPLKCGDQVLIVGLGTGVGTVKTATDSCPACNGLAQIDNFNVNNACSIIDLGNFQTIRINR